MTHPRGTPVWFELNVPDTTRARRFLADVAGWTMGPSRVAEHGGYLIADAPDGLRVAGIMTPAEGVSDCGWSIYFAVDEVETAVAQVASLGGALRFGPMDIPNVGRFAALTDPQGIVFVVLRETSADGSQAFRTRECGGGAGHAAWIELATPDPDGAFAFYGALFGWRKAGAMAMGEMGEYAFIGAGEDVRPGAIMSSVTTGAPARWNWYVHVPDIDAAITAATAGGGTLIQGPDQIPGGDYSANITDPAGAQLGLVGPRRS